MATTLEGSAAAPSDPDDDLVYVAPSRPSELRDMPDGEMFRMLRKVAFADAWPDGDKVRFEATARTIEALREFRDEARRSTHASFFLSALLVLLTLVLIAMTGVLVWLTTRL
jgi:hypothetical protein